MTSELPRPVVFPYASPHLLYVGSFYEFIGAQIEKTVLERGQRAIGQVVHDRQSRTVSIALFENRKWAGRPASLLSNWRPPHAIMGGHLGSSQHLLDLAEMATQSYQKWPQTPFLESDLSVIAGSHRVRLIH